MENLKKRLLDSVFLSNESNVFLLNGNIAQTVQLLNQLNESLLLEKCYVYNTSSACLPTESFYAAKQLVYQQLDKLEPQHSNLLVKYKKPLFYLMPWLKDENDLFKDVSLGLEIPQEQNPTSFTLSFVYQVINGIINFLLESARLQSKNDKVVFIFSNIDKTDFSSIRFIEQLSKRANQANFYLVGSYSEEFLPEKYSTLSKLKAISCEDIQSQCERQLNLEVKYPERDSIQRHSYHEKDLSTKYANLLSLQEDSKEMAESFKEAAFFSKRNACYEEAIYYVDILMDKYWGFFDDNRKAKLLRLKGVSHVLLKQNDIAMKCLEESINLSNDRYFKAKVCYIIGSFITKHIDEQLGQEWLDKGFSHIEGLKDKQAVTERLWLNNSRALYYFKNREYDRAIQIEKDNIKEFNLTFDSSEHLMTHAILNYNTAYALQDRGNYDEALSYINKAIDLVPSHLDLYNNKANILQAMGRYEEAVHYYDRVKEEGLPKDEVYLNCGNAKASLNIWDEALDDYNYSLFINPENITTWNSRGYLYYLTGDYFKAITDFEQSLKINPKYIPALLNRALAYEAVGHFNNALNDYRIIEEKNTSTIELYVNRASLYQKIGMLAESRADLKKAIELKPNQAEAYVNLAIVYNEEGNLLEAKNMLIKAVMFETNNPWIYFNKAYIHKALEEYNEAKSEIEIALKISPNEEEFSDLLIEINELLHQVGT
ncbi:tetratricopeptide repeat protein [Cytobacillus pseudoceanisediminis]|uniref:tetratricopeptide repeat protein n=1 Tax=Cytobacillus pseudoceanisediminis TaxID=3051614 RepID=UPI0036580875